jgi:hypothetical protein
MVAEKNPHPRPSPCAQGEGSRVRGVVAQASGGSPDVRRGAFALGDRILTAGGGGGAGGEVGATFSGQHGHGGSGFGPAGAQVTNGARAGDGRITELHFGVTASPSKPVQIYERTSGDHYPRESYGHGRYCRPIPDNSRPGSSHRATLQHPASVEEEETDAGQRRRQTKTESHDHHQSKPGPANCHRTEEGQQRRGAGEQPTRDAERQQVAPGESLPGRTGGEMAMRVAAMRVDETMRVGILVAVVMHMIVVMAMLVVMTEGRETDEALAEDGEAKYGHQ